MADAVVIGAGQNGLVAANLLADQGWDVLVLEEAPDPGGAVRSAELIEPGYVNDLFSAFYPFTAASPHMRRLDLEEWGLRWRRSHFSVAHPTRDGSCPAVAPGVDETAATLDETTPGDGDGWRRLYELWQRVHTGALGAFFAPFPPVRPVVRLLRDLGPAELLRLARFAALPVRRMGDEHFRGDEGKRLLAGNALHADVSPEMVPSGAFGWVLCSLAQQVGFPVPEGGAGQLTAALVRRLAARGGRVECGERVMRIECRGGRAVAVHTAAGRREAARVVIADTAAPDLYRDLLPEDRVPEAARSEIGRFHHDNGTVKVDWTLDGPIPWAAERARAAGTVHVGEGLDALTVYSSELARGLIPRDPYLVMGQYASFDETRAPAGNETAWAYTHVPQAYALRGDAREELTGSWDEAETERMADRIEEQVEALAPGFRALIRGRHVFTPPALEAADRNLSGGSINGGTAQLHQQLVFRPIPGLGRPDTPVANVFLGSSYAHPGGGVHGGPGANAARAALKSVRPLGRVARALQR